MIYRFRVILDHENDEDIFRDIEIRRSDTLEDLHNTITQSFGFDGSEMASFYLSDKDWNQGEEYSLFDLSEGANDVKLMHETVIEDVLDEKQTKLIYIYDFLNMWTFLVELAEIADEAIGTDYPNLMYVHGQIPTEPPKRKFESAEMDETEGLDEDYDVDDYDTFDFDENWN